MATKVILTAAEKLAEIKDFSLNHAQTKNTIDWQVTKKMEEFAKLHVQAALEAAAEEIYVDTSSGVKISEEELKKNILNAYPLNLIK